MIHGMNSKKNYITWFVETMDAFTPGQFFGFPFLGGWFFALDLHPHPGLGHPYLKLCHKNLPKTPCQEVFGCLDMSRDWLFSDHFQLKTK